MIELHGWLSIIETYKDEDLISQLEIENINNTVKDIILKSDCGIELQYMNGSPYINTLFCSNHRTAQVNQIIETYKRISQTATGSYGMIYFRDDEDAVYYNAFQVYVFKRGRCVFKTDTDFSPCIPTIEDGTINLINKT